MFTRSWNGDTGVGDRAQAQTLDALQPARAGSSKRMGRRLAAYRDEEGTIHAVSPACTHLGCYVQWNGAEKS